MGPVTKAVRVGVDIGQKVDPSAICVAELQERGTVRDSVGQLVERGQIHYVVRHLQRLPLGTPYPAVVDRLLQICDKLEQRRHKVEIRLDATGLGAPLVDLFRERSAAWRLGHAIVGHGRRSLVPVYLTGSDRATIEDGELRLGKAPMVSRLQVLLQQELIHLPDTAEAEAMRSELANFEIRVNENAHAQFGAFKTGTHDDLVVALGLACWREAAPRRRAWAKVI
jgi:hypothetical protein